MAQPPGPPEATVDLKGGGTRRVRAQPADGLERGRLWALLDEHNGWGSGIDGYDDRRSRPTAVVVLGPVG